MKRGNTASILGPLKAEVLDEVEKKKWKEQAAKRRRKTIHELRRKCAPREGLLRPHPSIERTQSQKNSDERKAHEKKVRGQKRKLEKKHNVYNWRHVLATLKNREELQDVQYHSPFIALY